MSIIINYHSKFLLLVHMYTFIVGSISNFDKLNILLNKVEITSQNIGLSLIVHGLRKDQSKPSKRISTGLYVTVLLTGN